MSARPLTRDSDTSFKIKRSKVNVTHQAALFTAVLARQAAAVVGVETCWPWETAACRLFGDARRFGAHGGRRGAG